MSKTSTVIRSLKKGRAVRVALEIRGSRGAWSAIRDLGTSKRMGYVLCKHLEIERPQETIRWRALLEGSNKAALKAFGDLWARLKAELTPLQKHQVQRLMVQAGMRECRRRLVAFGRRHGFVREGRWVASPGAGPEVQLELASIEEFCRVSVAAGRAEASAVLTPEQKMIGEQEKEKNPALRSIIP